VSDHKGYAFPPAAGYGVYMLIRGLVSLFEEPKRAAAPRTQAKRPIVAPPPTPATSLPTPPVVQWTSDRELLAWRAWRLAVVGEEGVRLLSLSAPCIWDGPAIRADVAPFCTIENPSGIYALKPAVAAASEWTRSEHCWVTGTVALSGRVVEHALGYRTECAVIRELRLGVGTHLAVRALDQLRNLMTCLEEHYQAPVDAGLAEREVADRMLTYGFTPRCRELPVVCAKPPWRVV
jgi:hypothetical protein